MVDAWMKKAVEKAATRSAQERIRKQEELAMMDAIRQLKGGSKQTTTLIAICMVAVLVLAMFIIWRMT